jgi:Lhr-like helicase
MRLSDSTPLLESFHPNLQEILLLDIGWDRLRPVEEETYQAITNGTDVVIIAPTASGKTEFTFIPVIDVLLKARSVRAWGHLSVSSEDSDQ